MALGFPYRGNTDILTLPIEHHGLNFLSISPINMGLVVKGLVHDLNHHIPAYQHVALVTLADWPCRINGCITPIDGLGLRCNFSHSYKKIPATWIIAQNTMMDLNLKLSLHLTDYSHILHGKISISDAINLYKVGMLVLSSSDLGGVLYDGLNGNSISTSAVLLKLALL